MVYILNGTEGRIDNATCDWIKNEFIFNIYLSCIYSEKSGNVFAPTIRVTCNSRLYTLEGAYEICHCFSHTSFPTTHQAFGQGNEGPSSGSRPVLGAPTHQSICHRSPIWRWWRRHLRWTRPCTKTEDASQMQTEYALTGVISMILTSLSLPSLFVMSPLDIMSSRPSELLGLPNCSREGPGLPRCWPLYFHICLDLVECVEVSTMNKWGQ